jgi:hypothetical protein
VGQQHDHWGNSNLMPSTYTVNGQPAQLSDDDDGIPGAFSTNFFTSQAIAWMQARAVRTEPFFLALTYPAAHDPFQRPPDARPGISDRVATIENIDKNVGRLLAFLDETGLAPDTLIIFLTDNGALGHFRAGKGSEFEGGHRVPCFVRWKNGGIAGRPDSAHEITELTAHIDLLPTLMGLLNLKDISRRPAALPLHGSNLATLLTTGMEAARSSLARDRILVVDNQRMNTLVKYKQAAVMQDEWDVAGKLMRKWRLVRTSADTGWMLFDVLADPLQKNDLAALPGQAAAIARLEAAYDRWWRDISARSDDEVRIVLGSDQQPRTCLYGHDWHTTATILNEVPWSQSRVAMAQGKNGVHAVEFARTGGYNFSLRRWPAEAASETTLTSALSKPLPFDGTHGVALPIHSARLRIWRGDQTFVDERKNIDPRDDAVSFTVAKIEPGPAQVEATFHDAAGGELAGAFYVYVEPHAR